MPILVEQSLRQPLPQFLSRSYRNIFLFFLKCVIMVIVISLFMFFLGFAAIVLLHFLFPSKIFRRRFTCVLRANASEAPPDIQRLIPEIMYRSADFPGKSDCAICLDSFREGDNCRSIPICKHLFHVKCVDRWIGKKQTCPVCRTPVDLGLWNSADDQSNKLWNVNLEGTSR